MAPESGQYLICNAQSMNFVALQDANRATALVNNLEDSTGTKISHSRKIQNRLNHNNYRDIVELDTIE